MLGSMFSLAAVFLYGTNSPGNAPAGRWERVPIANADFCGGSGRLEKTMETTPSPAQPVAIDQELGDAVWHGRTDVAAGAGSHTVPTIEVNFSLRKAALISWNPATKPAERASACLWNPLSGAQLRSRCSYLLVVEVDAGRHLAVEEWRRRGFSIALHTGATDRDHGVAFVNSLAEEADVQVENLKGTAQRLHLHFSTNQQPPSGNLGVVITANPAQSAPDSFAIDRYLLRSVALLVSAEAEAGFTASLDAAGSGSAGGRSIGTLPFSSSERMVPISTLADAQSITVLPEPSVLALIIGTIPLMLFRCRAMI